MSAPDTNVEKQAKNHFGPIIGIGAGVVFVGIILIAYLFFITDGTGEGEADIVRSPDVEAVDQSEMADDSVVPEAVQESESIGTDGNATIEQDDADTDQNPNSN